MYRVMDFDAAVRKLLDKKNEAGYLEYSSELLIYGICKRDFPEGKIVERLQDGASTLVDGWYVPNECFMVEIEDNKVNLEGCISALKEAAEVLNRSSCVGIWCGECPLNIGPEYGTRCIVPIINEMCVKAGV